MAFRGVTGRLGDLWRGRGEHVQQGLPLGVCVFCLLPRLRPQPLSQAGLAMREAGAKTARSVLSTHPTAEQVVREILGPGGGRGRGMGAAALESRRGSRPPSRPFSHLESGHDGLAAWKPVSAGTLGTLAQSSCQRDSRDRPAGRCWAGAPPPQSIRAHWALRCSPADLRAPGLCWGPREHRASPAPAGPTLGAGGQVAAGSEVGRGWAGLSGGWEGERQSERRGAGRAGAGGLVWPLAELWSSALVFGQRGVPRAEPGGGESPCPKEFSLRGTKPNTQSRQTRRDWESLGPGVGGHSDSLTRQPPPLPGPQFSSV